MKFCKDCRYLEKMIFEYTSVCNHPAAIYHLDAVTGHEYHMSAATMRMSSNDCGHDAKLFEQKISWFKKWFQK